MALPSLWLTEVNTDRAGITATTAQATQNGGSTLTVALTSRPTSTVTIGLSSSDPTMGMLATSSLSFDAASWDIPQVVAVTPAAGMMALPASLSVVTAAAVSADPVYSRLATPDLPASPEITTATADLTSAGGQDVFVSKLETSGNFAWARQAGGAANDTAGTLAVSAPNVVEVAGRYAGPAAFAGSVLQSIDSTNMFLARVSVPTASGPVDFANAIGVGSPTLDARGVVTDALGNSFVTGFFRGPADFNPSGTPTILNTVSNHDIYLASYSPTGALLWVRDLPSSLGPGAQGNGIALDASGNIVIVGSFAGSLTIGGGMLAATAGRTDAFVAKFTPSGDLLWAKAFEGIGVDQGNAVAVDALGNALVTGSYVGATAFGATTLTGAVASTFVTKIGPSGNVLWAKGFAGTATVSGTHIGIDAAGDAFVSGPYQGMVSIGATNLSLPAGASSAYVAKLTPTGAVSWAVGFGGTVNTTSGGLAVDPSGNVLVDGSFKSTVSLGGIALSSAGGSYNGYVAKLNTSGVGVWAKQVSGTDNIFVNSLATDAQGAAYLGGSFIGTANFNPGGGGAAAGPVAMGMMGMGAAGVMVMPTTGLVTTKAGGTATFSVMLDSAPSSTVTIGLAPGVAAEGTLSATSLAFTPMNWNMAQAVTVTGLNDRSPGTAVAYQVVASTAASADPMYGGLAVPALEVLNTMQPPTSRQLLELAARQEADIYIAAARNVPVRDLGTATLNAESKAMTKLFDFSAVTNVAIVSGNWSDPNTWSNQQVPGPNANVWIMPGRTVTIDGISNVPLRTVRVDGTIQFAVDRNTQLKADTIFVDMDGTFLMGTAATPIMPQYKATVLFADRGPIDRVWDPFAFSRGLISMGTVRVFGAATTGHVALAVAPTVGSTTLRLAGAQVNWKVGDNLVVTGTQVGQDESFTIAGISTDGLTVTLDHAALYDHTPPSAGLVAYAADTTRNAVFRSENTANIGQRGHVMFMLNPDVQLDSAGFYGLGRTDKTVPINDPVVDANGVLVPGTGTNPRARYSVHFHRTGTAPGGMPAMVVDCAAVDNPGWTFVNHSSDVIMEDNVAYKGMGRAVRDRGRQRDRRDGQQHRHRRRRQRPAGDRHPRPALCLLRLRPPGARLLAPGRRRGRLQ